MNPTMRTPNSLQIILQIQISIASLVTYNFTNSDAYEVCASQVQAIAMFLGIRFSRSA